MSSVAMAMLKPSPGCPSRQLGGNAATGEAQRAERVRCDDVDALEASRPGSGGIDDEGGQAFGSGPSPVRAKTT